MNNKKSIEETLNYTFVMYENSVRYLTICNYINYPARYEEYVKYKSNVDPALLYHILNISPHFQQYQFFSWMLFIIEIQKIIGGSTDKFSLRAIKRVIKEKSYIEPQEFSPVIPKIDNFFSKNKKIIKQIRELRNQKYAHSDYIKQMNEDILFKDAWNLLDSIKEILEEFGEILDWGFSFLGPGHYLSNISEFENHYLQLINSTDSKDIALINNLVGVDYLKKRGLK